MVSIGQRGQNWIPFYCYYASELVSSSLLFTSSTLGLAGDLFLMLGRRAKVSEFPESYTIGFLCK